MEEFPAPVAADVSVDTVEDARGTEMMSMMDVDDGEGVEASRRSSVFHGVGSRGGGSEKKSVPKWFKLSK